MKRARRGQGTLEYVIILVAVVAVIIAVARFLKPKVESSYDHLDAEIKAHIK